LTLSSLIPRPAGTYRLGQCLACWGYRRGWFMLAEMHGICGGLYGWGGGPTKSHSGTIVGKSRIILLWLCSFVFIHVWYLSCSDEGPSTPLLVPMAAAPSRTVHSLVASSRSLDHLHTLFPSSPGGNLHLICRTIQPHRHRYHFLTGGVVHGDLAINWRTRWMHSPWL
jgi:hypothetical protein